MGTAKVRPDDRRHDAAGMKDDFASMALAALSTARVCQSSTWSEYPLR